MVLHVREVLREGDERELLELRYFDNELLHALDEAQTACKH